MLIVHGGLSLAKITELKSILPNDHLSDTVPSIVIAIGAFILIIAIFGCFGALQSNICLLETYSICLLVLVLFQVILASMVFLFIDDIQKDAARSFSKLWRSRGTSRDSSMMVYLIQESLQCCGYKGSSDYTAEFLPKSCCLPQTECDYEHAFKIGCKVHLQESIRSSSQMISYLCIATAIFELSAAVMGFILSGFTRKVNAVRRCCYGY